MANFNYDPTQYVSQDWEVIPPGDYRVRINDVVEKTSKNGNTMFEITLDVSGKNAKLWYYLVLATDDFAKTNNRIGMFYHCFRIPPAPIRDGIEKTWVGKIGGVRVKHEDYNGEMQAKVHYLLKPEKIEKLPPWEEPQKSAGSSAPVSSTTIPEIADEDLPFNL